MDSQRNHLQINHSLNTKQKLSNKIIGTVVNKYKLAFMLSDRLTNLGVLKVNGGNLFVKNKSL